MRPWFYIRIHYLKRHRHGLDKFRPRILINVCIEGLDFAFLSIDYNMRLAKVFVHWRGTTLSVCSTLLQFSLLLTWPRHMRIFEALVTHHENSSLIIFCVVKISFHHFILLGLDVAWWGHHIARGRVVVIFIDSIFLLYIFVEERQDLATAIYWAKVLFLVLVHHQVRF